MNWDLDIKEFKSFLELEKGLSGNSVEAYINDVSKLEEFILEIKKYPINPELIQHNHLQEFINYVAELEICETTQARIISSIRSFYKFLMFDDKILKNPTLLLQPPRLTRKIPEILSVEEIDKLIETIDLSLDEGRRNRAIVETLYSCGLRVSELVNLKISNLFFEQGFIKVIGKGDKQRLVPISEKAIEEITEYLNNNRNQIKIQIGFEDIVFLNRRGKNLTRNMIFIIIKELGINAQIDKIISPHTFRHSFATHLMEGGANLRAVQEMLGHSSITTTEIYTHMDQSYLRDTIISFHPYGQKEKTK